MIAIKPSKDIRVNEVIIPANIVSMIPNNSIIYTDNKIDLSKLDVDINTEETKEFLKYLLNENDIKLIRIS
jgi:hypothetical protein